jgi:hypothetical protein
LVFVVEDLLAHLQLEGALSIIVHDEAKTNCDETEEPTDIGKHFIKLSEGSSNFIPDVRFSEKDLTEVLGCRQYKVPRFLLASADNVALLNMLILPREYALVRLHDILTQVKVGRNPQLIREKHVIFVLKEFGDWGNVVWVQECVRVVEV